MSAYIELCSTFAKVFLRRHIQIYFKSRYRPSRLRQSGHCFSYDQYCSKARLVSCLGFASSSLVTTPSKPILLS